MFMKLVDEILRYELLVAMSNGCTENHFDLDSVNVTRYKPSGFPSMGVFLSCDDTTSWKRKTTKSNKIYRYTIRMQIN